MDGAWTTKISPRVPARAASRNAKAAAADGDMRHAAKIVSLARYHRANSIIDVHHLANAAQVPQSFFPDVPRQEDIDRGGLAGAPEKLLQFDRRRHGEAVVPHSRASQPLARTLDAQRCL